jgi:hypothetical protein
VFIPMLEDQLVESSLTTFYLQHLEKIFRQKAYDKFL